jgi:hypothetical protein
MNKAIKLQNEIKKLIEVLSILGYDFIYDNKKNILTIRKKEQDNE